MKNPVCYFCKTEGKGGSWHEKCPRCQNIGGFIMSGDEENEELIDEYLEKVIGYIEKDAYFLQNLSKDSGLCGHYEKRYEENKKNACDAFYKLATKYELGQGMPKNEIIACKYFHAAAKLGDESAQLFLGLHYLYGTGVERNEEEAVRYFIMSAAQNHPMAQFYLGLSYLDGTGIEQNEEEGVHCLFMSAEQNYPDAQFFLALSYLEGTGVEQNEKEGLKWLKKSADGGCEEAKATLSKMGL